MEHFCRSTIVRSTFVASLAIAAGIGSLCAPEHAWSAQINAQTDPQTLIQTVTQQILDEVRKQALTPDDIPRIMNIVNRDILPYVDFRRTTQYAMGRFWRTSTPEQQDQVVEQFKQLLIHTYSGALTLVNTDQKFEYPPSPTESSDTDAVVRTIEPGKNGQVQIDYRLYKSPQGWRVYDMNVLGAWLIQAYQQQFSERDRFKCDRHFFQAVLPFAVHGRSPRLRRTASKRLPDRNDSQLARCSSHGNARRCGVSRMLVSTCH